LIDGQEDQMRNLSTLFAIAAAVAAVLYVAAVFMSYW
jgi:hypothetical protein